MVYRIKILLYFIYLCVGLGIKANAQFGSDNTDRFNDVKASTTYVVLPDTGMPELKLFKSIFRKYWTYNPVKFITKDQVVDLQSSGGATFFSHEEIVVNVQGFCYTMPQCKLWIYRKKLPAVTMDVIHPHELPIVQEALAGIADLFTNPGYEKNSLQYMCSMLKDKRFQTPQAKQVDDDETGNLKTDTLYIPSEFLQDPLYKNRHGVDSACYIAPKENDPKYTGADIQTAYPYPFKIINLTDLNTMILKDENKAYYYFWFSEGNAGNYFAVMNSQTGNQVFSIYSGHASAIPRIYSLSDFKDLAKQIKKGK